MFPPTLSSKGLKWFQLVHSLLAHFLVIVTLDRFSWRHGREKSQVRRQWG
jgi:hypothetical protein